ncbi:DUF5103 domain-containing protein [Saccharicrinis sp. FJH54]|uniref:type IX secretion system plug protein n=1 Tax=Saccharicrinis sp. FJH54 TaxID=3344665 RepID=UPI0035D496FD
MLKINTLLFLFILTLINSYGIEPYFTHITSPDFKTLQVYNSDNILSYPAIALNGGDQIIISFDELSDSEQSLKYHITHCNSDWLPSDLTDTEVITGFKTSFIDDYEYSINTNVPYVHYKLKIPNDYTSLKVSGNYVVTVTGSNSKEPVLTACFYVYENTVNIVPEVAFVTETDIRKENQQINFVVSHPELPIQDPATEMKIFIQQNDRRDNIKSGIQPTFIKPNQLVYEHNADLVFKGGNEFRYFEATSTRYNTHGIQSIQYYAPYYHMVLIPDEPQSKISYSYRHDVNGKFFVRRQEADQDNLALESDYVIVHFTIRRDDPYFNGKIFLNGDFTYGEFSDPYEMKYDFDEKAYNTNILLKQGRYDYQYLFLPTGEKIASYSPYENNFFETENDYRIYAYYRSFSDRYDRLVGYTLVTANAK